MNKLYLIILTLTTITFSQGYDRSEWGRWNDPDRNCIDTRQEVLIEESLIPVVMDKNGCRVTSGLWFCLFTGNYYTNPSDLDIDHVVPLKETHLSGGDVYNKSQKLEYFNNRTNANHLMAVYKGANRSKGSRSPDQWMPKFEPFKCTYIQYWLKVKSNYNLDIDTSEKKFLINMINKCK